MSGERPRGVHANAGAARPSVQLFRAPAMPLHRRGRPPAHVTGDRFPATHGPPQPALVPPRTHPPTHPCLAIPPTRRGSRDQSRRKVRFSSSQIPDVMPVDRWD